MNIWNSFFRHNFLTSSCSTPEDEKNHKKWAFFIQLSISTVIVIILYTTILWKQNQFQQKINKKQQNVVTLKQTVAIRVWLTIDYFVVDLLVFPELCSQISAERATFYMTEQRKVPRQLISSIQSDTGSRLERKKTNFIYVKPA